MRYPGRTIRKGEQDPAIVKALKLRLNKVLAPENKGDLKLDPAEASFGPKMESAVKFFQARHLDMDGRPLNQDGAVGPNTWQALFETDAVHTSNAPRDPYLGRVLQTAAAEEAKKVREVPRNSNRGPEVERYLASTGTPPGNSWCCAFVYWCFNEAAQNMGRANPMPKTAGCLDHWQRAKAKGVRCVAAAQAGENPALVESGMVFVMDHGAGLGHTGLVEKVNGAVITTIEGNTDASKSREGGGVYRLTRQIADINKGFIDYTG
jgi:hypothetical protein